MSHNILITGASGYLGGTLLARWAAADLPPYGKLYALVRTEQQAQAVKQKYGAVPLTFDPYVETAVLRGVVDNQITVIYHLIDAFQSDSQVYMIKALVEVKKTTGQAVHFLHVSSPAPILGGTTRSAYISICSCECRPRGPRSSRAMQVLLMTRNFGTMTRTCTKSRSASRLRTP